MTSSRSTNKKKQNGLVGRWQKRVSANLVKISLALNFHIEYNISSANRSGSGDLVPRGLQFPSLSNKRLSPVGALEGHVSECQRCQGCHGDLLISATVLIFRIRSIGLKTTCPGARLKTRWAESGSPTRSVTFAPWHCRSSHTVQNNTSSPTWVRSVLAPGSPDGPVETVRFSVAAPSYCGNRSKPLPGAAAAAADDSCFSSSFFNCFYTRRLVSIYQARACSLKSAELESTGRSGVHIHVGPPSHSPALPCLLLPLNLTCVFGNDQRQRRGWTTRAHTRARLLHKAVVRRRHLLLKDVNWPTSSFFFFFLKKSIEIQTSSPQTENNTNFQMYAQNRTSV